MKIKLKLIGLAALFLLSACATGAQQQSNQLAQVKAETMSAGKDCYDGIYAKPDYAHLKTKMFLSTSGTAPLQYLTDSTRPNKNEIADLYKLHADVQACRKIFLTGMGRYHPALVNVAVQSYDATDKLWAEFTKGRMTWGNFNKENHAITVRTNQQTGEVETMIASQLQNEHQYEMEQRQRAAASLQQWAYQQQVLENQRLQVMAQGHDAAMAAMRPSPVITCNYQSAYTMVCQ